MTRKHVQSCIFAARGEMDVDVEISADVLLDEYRRYSIDNFESSEALTPDEVVEAHDNLIEAARLRR